MGPEQHPDRSGEPTSEFRPIPPQGQPGPPFQQGPQFQHGQHFPSPPPGYAPQKPGMSAGLAVAFTLMVVFIVALLGAVAYFLVPGLTGSSAAPAVTSTVAVTSSAPAQPENPPTGEPQVQPATGARPAGAYECTNSGGGQLSRTAAGSSATSCEFAASVRSAYLAAGGGGGAMVIDAHSPVTGNVYTMSCGAGPPVSCTGGNNAVVYIY